MRTNHDHIDLLARHLQRQHGVVLGKHRGKVTRVGTGENLGRIKAVIPTLFGEEETVWAEPVVPFAGKQHGMLFLPEVGDGVWMEFEGGNTSRPIWTGFFWGAKQMPPGVSEKVRAIATSHGHRVVIDDDKDELRLEHGNGPKLVLGKDSITLTVGSKKLVLDTRGLTVNDGALEVT
ncbi:MAG: phage baseplate assembly protein V [Kofleriaceae bacterium]